MVAWPMRAAAAPPVAVLALVVAACGDGQVGRTSGPSPAASTAEPSSSPAAPSVLEVTCDVDGVQVSTAVVAAEREGVAVRFQRADDDDGEEWAIAWHEPRGSGAGENMPTGLVHLPIPPGPGASVSCTPLSAAYETEPDETRWEAVIEVVDPHDHWVDDRLDCETVFGFAAARAAPAEPVPLDQAPEEVADVLREYRVQPSEIRAAGYAGSDAPSFVVVRDDQVVARVPTHAAGEGRVIVDWSAELCESLR